jgi:hypothetical protein
MRRFGFAIIMALALGFGSMPRSVSAAGITRSFDALTDAQRYCALQYLSSRGVVRKDNYDSSSGSPLYLPGRTIYVTSDLPDFRNAGFAGVYVCEIEAVQSGWLSRAILKTYDACPANGRMNYFATKLPGNGGEAIVEYPSSMSALESAAIAKVAKNAPQGRYCSFGGSPLFSGWRVMSVDELVPLVVPSPSPSPIARESAIVHPIYSPASYPPEPAMPCTLEGTGSYPGTLTITLRSGHQCTIRLGTTVMIGRTTTDLVVTRTAVMSIRPQQTPAQITIPLAVVTSVSTGKHTFNAAQITMSEVWTAVINDLKSR